MFRRLLIFTTWSVWPLLAIATGFDAATATNQLGIDLYRQLAKSAPHGNLVISPYSIDSALALAYAGAEGATRIEMAAVLHFPSDNASLQASFGNLHAALEQLARDSAAHAAAARKQGDEEEAIEWHQANRLFGQQGYAFRPAFLTLMKEGFDAPFETLDFNNHADVARVGINHWVEDRTEGKIRDLLPANALNPSTRLALVNALYLKAPWRLSFEKAGTRKRPFHIDGAESQKVPTMQRTASLGYRKERNFTVVDLEYTDSDLHFLILLPDPGTDCAAVAAKLTSEDFQSWAQLGRKTGNARVELYLPKFRLEGDTLPLGPVLHELGLKQAFDDPQGTADFSGIAPRRPDGYLKLSEVFHKTFLAVDEHGTEAAAATAVLSKFSLGVERPPITVRVDRPFLFAIQHRSSAACLFFGRIADPH